MSSSNIFGLVRIQVVILGLTFLQIDSLSPAERTWLQENSEAKRNEFNKNYLDFVGKVQAKLNLESEEKAYNLVKSYYRGDLEDIELADTIELIALKNPRPRQQDIELEELTFFINSRLVKSEFPKAEFKETFGLEFKSEWTIEHTKAIAEIAPKIDEFFTREANNGKAPEVSTEEKKTA